MFIVLVYPLAFMASRGSVQRGFSDERRSAIDCLYGKRFWIKRGDSAQFPAVFGRV
jgi:hypothetical protein